MIHFGFAKVTIYSYLRTENKKKEKVNTKSAAELGTKPIGRLLAQYAIPSIVAMMASSLLNIIDRVFIGQFCGPLAISGLAITLPLMNLTTAFGAMVGVGASTLISVSLGQKDYKKTRRILGNAVTLNLIVGIVVGVISLVFLNAILQAFGASENTIGYARDYMVVIMAGNVFSHMYFGLNAVLRAVGHPRTAMATTLTAIGMNAILDFLFIYVFDCGIRGAAVATVVSQMVALVWQMKILTNPNELVHLCRGTFRLSTRLVQRMLGIGLSPFLMHLAACTVVIFLNKGLEHYSGDMAVGAYGIANSIALLFAMIVFGFNQGMQPIVGFNYGAKNYGRVKEILTKTIFCATVVTTLSFVVALVCPELVVRIFTTDEELISLGAKSYRIMVIAFPIVGFQMVTTNFFQSVGMAGMSIFLSLTRQLLFLLPCILVLPLFFGADGVLASIPVSDCVSSILASYFLYRQMKHLKIEMS